VEANDYRVLQPRLVSDPNRNRSEVAFDVLGMAVGTAVMGKALPAPQEGDLLAGFVQDPSQSDLDAFFSAPVEANSADLKRSQATTNSRVLLADATSRTVYDLGRFWITQAANPGDPSKWQPAVAATIARETHVSDENGTPSRLQVSFSYSDGFGREIQKKIQAEPGRLDPHNNSSAQLNPRWVGGGWTVFNNKGKPVRQYEPFFSDTHDFEFGVIRGVSPVLFYDPADRVVATLHPNHTWEKVVFGPWQQTSWDVNDTVARFDLASRTASVLDLSADQDVGGFFQKLASESHTPSWYELRTDPAKALLQWPDVDAQGTSLADNANRRASEKKAAERAAAHADTPTTAHFDALGRPFLTVEHNRVVCKDHALDGKPDEEVCTRVELDIEGNQRSVRDAITHTEERDAAGSTVAVDDPLGRIVMRYAYDMLGNRIYQLSMEAGARWMLNDVAGKAMRAWDSRGHSFTTTYDALRRPLHQYVHGTSAESDPRTRNPANPEGLLVDKIDYGEALANAEAINLRTRIYRHSDSAGVATNAQLDAGGNPVEAYDFKGNLLRSTRQLISDYKAIPDWLLDPQFDAELFESSTRYDALNRPVQSVAPHSNLSRAQQSNKINVIQPVFNEANLLERVDVWLERAAEPTALLDPRAVVPSPVGVENIDHDAKGQRRRIDYKNGTSTVYSYERLTFRLSQLLTLRGAELLQNLHYNYDPAGNITHIQDDAQQAIYFRNRIVEPSNDYTYDAFYRLIQASGREHLGQAGGAPIPHSHDDRGRVGLPHPGDGNAMDTYVERYVYDFVGNFLQMQHRGSDPTHPGWTRRYTYSESSLIEAGKQSNRLSSTQVGNGVASAPEAYQHDTHGNMLRMPHLGGGAVGPNMHWDYKDQLRRTDLGGGGTAFYVYDASGQRVRKVVERNNSNLIEERIYLGGFELFRRHGGPIGANTATLERETLHVMDDQQRIALVETRTLDMASSDQAPRQLIRYQFGNHLGSASLELDEQAQIISYEEYAPYGSSTYQAVRGQTETAKRYRYTGKERDEESGLSYHGARYYAAWTGRWLSCDPLSPEAGINCFVAFLANPISWIDPDGRQVAPPQQAAPPPGAPKETVLIDGKGQVQVVGFERKGLSFQPRPGSRLQGSAWVDNRWSFGNEPHFLGSAREITTEGALSRLGLTDLLRAESAAKELKGADTSSFTVFFTHRGTVKALDGGANLMATWGGAQLNYMYQANGMAIDPNSINVVKDGAAYQASGTATRFATPSPHKGTFKVVSIAEPPPPPAPNRLAGATASAVEAAPKVLRFVGQVMTVVGAANEADETDQLLREHNEGRFVRGFHTLAVGAGGVIAGMADDALMAQQTAVMGAPVITFDSWERNGSGPLQHAFGDLYRSYLNWAYEDNGE